MKKLIQILKSMRLAVVLILLIAILSILSTMIPQGEDEDFYKSAYPSFLSVLILSTGFHNYSSSLLLIVPVVLFSINLVVCTIERLSREFTKKIPLTMVTIGGKKIELPLRIGPDIIHTGILVLIIGSLFTITGRVEEFTYLGEGDSVTILDKYMMIVEKCEYIQYDDGRPKDWISTVSIMENDKKIVHSFPVEVNKPLSFKGLKIMQTSYSDEPVLMVADMDGNEFHWLPGHMIKTDPLNKTTIGPQQNGEVQSSILFHGINTNPHNEDDVIALFEKKFDDGTNKLIYARQSDKIGNYVITEAYIRDVTGLTFIIDPGFVPVITGLILIGLGLTLTFIQKIGAKKT